MIDAGRSLCAFVVALMVAFPVLPGVRAAVSSTGKPPVVTTIDAGQFDYVGDWRLLARTSLVRTSNSPAAFATIRFSGTQIALYGQTGPAAGIASVSVDGGPAYQVDFYTPAKAPNTQMWVSTVLPRGMHTLVVRPTGLKNNSAQATAIAPYRAEAYDAARTVDDQTTEGGPSTFRYSGDWRAERSPDAWSGSTSVAEAPTATATLQFTGTGLQLYGGVGPSGGRAIVSIDGKEGQVDTYAEHEAVNRLIWQSSPLALGQHEAVVRPAGVRAGNSKGTRVVVDRADIWTDTVHLALPTPSQTLPHGWTQFARNPVLGKSYGTAFDISVLREDGVYRMWFSWRPQRTIGYVESVDGVSWTAPVSVLSPSGVYWEGIINRPNVIRTPDGTYRMWYTGQSGKSSWIGYATSPDGIRWTRQGNRPAIAPTETWEQASVMNPSVLYDAEKAVFVMWYCGGEQWEPNAIGYATSSDGLHWKKHPANPILEKNVANFWEQDRVAGIQVIRPGDGYYYAFYIGYSDIDTASIGIARSSDGITGWQRMPSNPIIKRAPGWECAATYKPYVVWEAETATWKLWYNGRCGGVEQVGMAFHPGESLGF